MLATSFWTGLLGSGADETTTHRGELVWKVGAALTSPDPGCCSSVPEGDEPCVT